VSRLSPVSVKNSRNRSSMKPAFERIGARHRRAFWSPVSFYRKRLSLVEQLEKNGLNKEIRRTTMNPRSGCKPTVNYVG
jgi:hypothetical protein